jgi:hypothetical protein
MIGLPLKTLGKVGGLLLLPLALFVLPTAWLERRRSLCLIRAVTGKPCPGCGITRATSRVFHGDLPGALRYNKLVVIVLPILGYEWLRALSREYERLLAFKRAQ